MDKIDDDNIEKITTTGFLNKILELFIKDLEILKKVQHYFFKIMNIIPDLIQIKIKKDDNINTKIIYDITEFVILITSIILITQFSKKNFQNNKTIEGTIFIIFTLLLVLVIIHTIYLYLFDESSYILNSIFFFIHKIPLYFIVFIFSFLLHIFLNIPNWIKLLFSGIYDLLISAVEKLKLMMKNPEEVQLLYKYGSLYSVILIIIIVFYYALLDPNAHSSNTLKYTIMIALPLIAVFSFVIPFTIRQNPSFKILLIAIITTTIFAMIYFYLKTNSATFLIMEYITAVILFMAIISAMSIFFYIMSNYFKSLSGIQGFITYFIFYIPCLFIDFIKYILSEIHSTSSPILILFVFEIILLILYLLLPIIVARIKWTKNNVLLPNSAFLDIKQNISSGELNKIPQMLASTKPVFNQNYSFSMWVYLNPQSQSFAGYSKESNVFNYGEGKPKITYYNDMTTVSNNFGASGVDKFKIYFSNSTSPVAVYKFTLPSQKWNNIVVNFSSIKADLFVNGKLEKTYTYEGNQPTYDPVDFITIGETGGLDGAICNIVYYSYPLSLMEITSHYNILSLRNPPTFT